MAERRNIPKKTRFEVFKRDSFTCQYCGKTAPDVILELDHLKPVAKGGGNELLNLVTACQECNRGKGARELSDDSVLKRQHAQLADINERRQQMEMMLDWQRELNLLTEKQVDAINDIIQEAYNMSLNAQGRAGIKNLFTRFGFMEVYESTKIALSKYEDANYALSKIGGVCYNRRRARLDGE